MNKCLLLLAGLLIVVTPLFAQNDSDHFEFGAFAEYFRFSDAATPQNFVGIGGRAGFNVHPDVQIEAEMAYDFQRNFTNTFSNGITTEDVTTKFRTLHGFFGPKFQTGSGPFRVFVTGKVGFDNFSVNNQNASAGFTNTVGLTTGRTDFAIYPGGGIEAFAGFIGVRAEVGDDVFFDNGAHNNFKASLGPQFRF
jgi:hypothetical protein